MEKTLVKELFVPENPTSLAQIEIPNSMQMSIRGFRARSPITNSLSTFLNPGFTAESMFKMFIPDSARVPSFISRMNDIVRKEIQESFKDAADRNIEEVRGMLYETMCNLIQFYENSQLAIMQSLITFNGLSELSNQFSRFERELKVKEARRRAVETARRLIGFRRDRRRNPTEEYTSSRIEVRINQDMWHREITSSLPLRSFVKGTRISSIFFDAFIELFESGNEKRIITLIVRTETAARELKWVSNPFNDLITRIRNINPEIIFSQRELFTDMIAMMVERPHDRNDPFYAEEFAGTPEELFERSKQNAKILLTELEKIRRERTRINQDGNEHRRRRPEATGVQ